MENPILFIIPGACSLGSQVALEWLNIPYQVSITTPEIRQSEAFRKINPMGKVGALKNGESVVGENLAILLYIADKYDLGNHCPSQNGTRQQVYQWLSYLSSTLHPVFGHFNYPDRFIAAEYAENLRSHALERLHTQLQFINDSINEHGYLLSNEPTIVDAQAFGLLRWTYKAARGENLVDTSKYTKLQQFFTNMKAQKVVQNALAIENQQLELLKDSKFAGYFTF